MAFIDFPLSFATGPAQEAADRRTGKDFPEDLAQNAGACVLAAYRGQPEPVVCRDQDARQMPAWNRPDFAGIPQGEYLPGRRSGLEETASYNPRHTSPELPDFLARRIAQMDAQSPEYLQGGGIEYPPGKEATWLVRFLSRIESRSIRVEGSTSVMAYLTKHTDIVGVLERLLIDVKSAFPDEAEIAIAMYRDPEVDDEYLTVYVNKRPFDDRDLETVDDVLERFSADLTGRTGWVVVMPDFRKNG